jgi:hypothetical protein
MDNRSLNIAYVNAELKAKADIAKYQKEYENAKNTGNGQNNQTQGNVPASNAPSPVQQPSYGG